MKYKRGQECQVSSVIKILENECIGFIYIKIIFKILFLYIWGLSAPNKQKQIFDTHDTDTHDTDTHDPANAYGIDNFTLFG